MKTLMVMLASVAIASVSNAQSTEVLNTRVPFAGATVNPCNGEPIAYTGECHLVEHTRNAGSGEAVMLHTNCHAEGVGALSNTYTVNSNSMSRSEPLACGTSQRFRQINRFISPRSTSNFYMTVTFVVTTDENCQPQVEVDETDTRCTGKTGF